MSHTAPNIGEGIPVAPVVQSFINASAHVQGEKSEYEQPGSAFALIGAGAGAFPSGAGCSATLGRQNTDATVDSSLAMRLDSDVKPAAVPLNSADGIATSPLSASVPLIDLEGEPPCMTTSEFADFYSSGAVNNVSSMDAVE